MLVCLWVLQTAYAASKAGLNAISEGLHRELRPFDIDVVVIAPGAFPLLHQEIYLKHFCGNQALICHNGLHG